MRENWLQQKGYLQGVFWILVVSITSNINDILMRLAGYRLPAMEVAFFRFFFATLTLLPVMLYYGKATFRTANLKLHGLRSCLLFGAIAFWCRGVTMLPLAEVSILALTVPLFVLPMAAVFLREKVGWQRALATLIGFLGVLMIVIGESKPEASVVDTTAILNRGTFYMIAACIFFAVSDILNKKMLVQESNLCIMFYVALGTMLLSLLPAYLVWQTPTLQELAFLLFLGIGGNLILFFLLKAFAAADVSALAPYRYTEVLSAGTFGWLLFHETPTFWTVLGASIIVPTTFVIGYYETHQHQKKLKAGRPR